MKYAVYVEGQSELLFVADVLQKYSNYDHSQCGFLCINLCADNYERLNSPRQGDTNSANYYLIVNVNNDNRVVSKLKKDIPSLIEQGYNVIIGLKDVFGEAYEKMMNGKTEIDRAKIELLHSIQTKALDNKDGDCRLHFAIMEYEAWMLALIEGYVSNKGLNYTDVCQKLNINVDQDPETTVYHPYNKVRQIYQACGSDYHKHGRESHSFLSTLDLEGYEKLRHSEKCISFRKFIDSLLGGVIPPLP